MTPLLALLAMQPVGDLRVVELPETSKNPTISVALRAPGPLEPREQAAWWIFARSLTERNERYMFTDLLSLAAPTEEPLEIEVNDELVTITLSTPPGQLPLGARYLEAMLRRPRITQDLVKEVRAELARPVLDDLSAIHLGRRGAFERVDTIDVRDLWVKMMRPEHLAIAVTQSETPGANAGAVRREFADWPTIRATPRPSQGSDTRFHGPRTAQVSAFGWSPIAPRPDQGLRLAALTALGTGLSSSVHRITRDIQGLSYLQQTIYKPGRLGWNPMLIFIGRKSLAWEDIAPALRKDVESWDADTLRTTLGVLDTSLKGDFALGSFPTGPESVYRDNLRSRLQWAAYAALIGSDPNPDGIRAAANQIKLEDLKAEALRLLDTAIRL